MDADVAKELEDIMEKTDQEEARKCAERLSQYMLSVTTIPPVYSSLVQRFTDFSFRILHGSSLPIALASKFGLHVKRVKRVSFQGTNIFKLEPEIRLSREAEQQRIREASSLSISNTDSSKSFKPKNAVERGISNKVIKVPVVGVVTPNAFTAEYKKTGKDIPRFNIDVGKLLVDPSSLEKILRKL